MAKRQQQLFDKDYLATGLMLVDTSYTVFYRFNALKTWWNHAHPMEKRDDTFEGWHLDEKCVETFYNSYESHLIKLAKETKIRMSNIVFAIDCQYGTCWRYKLFSQYKATRYMNETSSRRGVLPFFGLCKSVLIPRLVEKYGCKVISLEYCEADDIIGTLAVWHYRRNTELNYSVIISSDHDYAQIVNEHITLYSMSGVKNNLKETGISGLLRKAFCGDSSDNIGSCMVDASWLTIGKSSKYVKAGNAALNKILTDTEKFDDLSRRVERYLDGGEYDIPYCNEDLRRNLDLVSFRRIPQEHLESMLRLFDELF